MANLVAPVSMLKPVEERIIEFRGLNRKSAIEDGEMQDMLNLTSDNYPLLTQRKPRAIMELPAGVLRPIRLVRRFNKIGMIALDEDSNVSFYFDGEKVDAVTGLTTETKAVAINTKLCFFPQKTYVDIRQVGSLVVVGEYGDLEASVSVSTTTVTISNEDARITLASNPGFKYDDALNISGSITYTSGGTTKTVPCTVSCIVEEVVTDTTLVLPRETFIELTGENPTDVKLTATISRTMPDLDFVVEWNNRLWGASNSDNTVYACKLGDPTNWQYFQGTSLDSYYAQQGTDEYWTGVAEYSSHIIFFKQNSMTRIYGTAPSNYQVTNTKVYGVEDGSSASVLTINDRVFYKSSIGIMVYEGGIPYCISEKFNADFKNVIAGTEGQKYYASCLMIRNGSAVGELMVLDIEKGLWHKEDSLRFVNCLTMDNKLYYTTVSGDILYCDTTVYADPFLMVGTENVEGYAGIINPQYPTESYEDMDWMAIFGPFDEYIEEKKIYSKLALRLVAKGDASAKIYISINEGAFEKVCEYEHISTNGDFIPIVPRRCDRYSVKIEGKGNCELKSLTRRVRQGSFGRL